jgi:glycosyltransferase involved in cell wall biosynthesis
MMPEKIEEETSSSSAKHADEPDASAELPPIQSEPISAVLPIYNDRPVLQPSLEAWISVLNGLNRDYEIFLVDDASGDGSLDFAQNLAEKNARVQVLRHESHVGFGACLRTGLAAARFPLLLISTCDGSYEPVDVTRLLQWIDKVHLVVGIRSTADAFPSEDSKGAPSRPTTFKRHKRTWAERCFHWFIRFIFGLRLKDPECWFLLARRSIFARIPIQSSGPFAFAELLAKANFLGCLMSEVPVACHPTPEAYAKWSNAGLREKLVGFRRVFSHPDFGPAKLADK